MPVKRAYHTAVWLNELVYLGGGHTRQYSLPIRRA